MWLVTQQGFFSIVRHRTEANCFLVRARVRQDLDSLASLTGLTLDVLTTPNADYGYRAFVNGPQLVTILTVLGEDIDYPNFKSRIHSKADQQNRYHIYTAAYGELEALRDLDQGKIAVS